MSAENFSPPETKPVHTSVEILGDPFLQQLQSEAEASFGKKFVDSIIQEMTVANGLSLARPALAWAATRVDMKKHPKAYAAMMAMAFGSDGLDGLAARKFGPSPMGDMVDIIADRATEQIVLRDAEKHGKVDQGTADIFLARGVLTDSIRIATKASQKGKEVQNALKIGSKKSGVDTSDRVGRITYALNKAAIGVSGSLLPSEVTRALGKIALDECIERGVPVIMNPENIALAKKGLVTIFNGARRGAQRMFQRGR